MGDARCDYMSLLHSVLRLAINDSDFILASAICYVTMGPVLFSKGRLSGHRVVKLCDRSLLLSIKEGGLSVYWGLKMGLFKSIS